MTQAQQKPSTEEMEQYESMLDIYRASTRQQKANMTLRMAMADIIQDMTDKGQQEITSKEIIEHLFKMIDEEMKERGDDILLDMWVNMCCSFYQIASKIGNKMTIEKAREHYLRMMGQQVEKGKIILLN